MEVHALHSSNQSFEGQHWKGKLNKILKKTIKTMGHPIDINKIDYRGEFVEQKLQL